MLRSASHAAARWHCLRFDDCAVLGYTAAMPEIAATPTEIAPSATIADEADLAAWNALSRDEQVRRYRDALAHPACDTLTADSMSDILAAARQRVAARRHG